MLYEIGDLLKFKVDIKVAYQKPVLVIGHGIYDGSAYLDPYATYKLLELCSGNIVEIGCTATENLYERV